MSTEIWIVEDLPEDANDIERVLSECCPGSEVRKVETELNFRELLEGVPTPLPQLVILDMSLRWIEPGPLMPPPPGEPEEAGYRCARLLTDNPRTRNIPVLLFTIFEEAVVTDQFGELPPHFAYLRKKEGFPGLAEKVQELLKGSAERSTLPDTLP